eukprot:GHVO01031156.1.p3 GENE.GHVO01031156.1~~GHVO01031156.1.p3  ORF type:complete len:121 (+),score=4.13 GHVO01031156.1:246-608(+)
MPTPKRERRKTRTLTQSMWRPLTNLPQRITYLHTFNAAANCHIRTVLRKHYIIQRPHIDLDPIFKRPERRDAAVTTRLREIQNVVRVGKADDFGYVMRCCDFDYGGEVGGLPVGPAGYEV